MQDVQAAFCSFHLRIIRAPRGKVANLALMYLSVCLTSEKESCSVSLLKALCNQQDYPITDLMQDPLEEVRPGALD